MKLLIENLFWIIIIIFGSIYLIFLEIENYNNKKYLKYKIKFTEEYIVEMKIINKTFSKGTIMRIGGAILPSVLPNTYTIELEYEGSNYEINDKEIFNSYQQKYLNGYAGVIINNIDDRFEVYTYIKNKDKIASPLLLWKTDSEEKANNYYNRLVEIIKSQDYNVLIGFCKSGL